jgi:hypothetical protein
VLTETLGETSSDFAIRVANRQGWASLEKWAASLEYVALSWKAESATDIGRLEKWTGRAFSENTIVFHVSHVIGWNVGGIRATAMNVEK